MDINPLNSDSPIFDDLPSFEELSRFFDQNSSSFDRIDVNPEDFNRLSMEAHQRDMGIELSKREDE